jgi:cytosine/uracil/thiamine/allantoin permease
VSYRVTLIILLFVGFVLYALWYALVVAFKPTAYPRALAWSNPLVYLILFGLLGALVPMLRFIFLPAGINLANLLFFVSSTLFRREVTPLRAGELA